MIDIKNDQVVDYDPDQAPDESCPAGDFLGRDHADCPKDCIGRNLEDTREFRRFIKMKNRGDKNAQNGSLLDTQKRQAFASLIRFCKLHKPEWLD